MPFNQHFQNGSLNFFRSYPYGEPSRDNGIEQNYWQGNQFRMPEVAPFAVPTLANLAQTQAPNPLGAGLGRPFQGGDIDTSDEFGAIGQYGPDQAGTGKGSLLGMALALAGGPLGVGMYGARQALEMRSPLTFLSDMFNDTVTVPGFDPGVGGDVSPDPAAGPAPDTDFVGAGYSGFTGFDDPGEDSFGGNPGGDPGLGY